MWQHWEQRGLGAWTGVWGTRQLVNSGSIYDTVKNWRNLSMVCIACIWKRLFLAQATESIVTYWDGKTWSRKDLVWRIWEEELEVKLSWRLISHLSPFTFLCLKYQLFLIFSCVSIHSPKLNCSPSVKHFWVLKKVSLPMSFSSTICIPCYMRAVIKLYCNFIQIWPSFWITNPLGVGIWVTLLLETGHGP